MGKVTRHRSCRSERGGRQRERVLAECARSEFSHSLGRLRSNELMRSCYRNIVPCACGTILYEHARVMQRSHHLPAKTIYDWRHYLAVVRRKPGALRNGAPFLELPNAFRQLQDHMLRKAGGDREMVDILALVLQHDEQAVLTAVEMALEGGVRRHIGARMCSARLRAFFRRHGRMSGQCPRSGQLTPGSGLRPRAPGHPD